MWGQVVGINSSKYVATDFEGIGFAIAFNDAKPIIETLIENGYVPDRVKIGIVFYSITDTMAKDSDIPAGLYITDVDSGCDVANTDLKPDDIITEVEGKPVQDAKEVLAAINGKKAGATITAKVVRINKDETKKEFEIKFKLMDDTEKSK